jgi:multidrug efflux pump subunit AcrA (membrane-fusion protein)
MLKKRVVWVAAVIAVIAAGATMATEEPIEVEPTVATAPVTRGDVVEIVDATGTLQAVTTAGGDAGVGNDQGAARRFQHA